VRRTFLPPNQLLEESSTGAVVLQVIPESAAGCRIRRLDYGVRRLSGRKKVPELSPLSWLRQDIEVAESTQRGLTSGAVEAQDAAPVSPELAEFRQTVAALLAGVEGPRRGGG
jgi:hypothetical protein